MRLLLDTHAFLWFISGNDRLSNQARNLIEDPRDERLVSAVRLWEIAIKVGIGKLTLTEPFGPFISRELQTNAMAILPVKLDHLAKLLELPLHHRDPFDRLLAAQALAEQSVCVSLDHTFDTYGVPRQWWIHDRSLPPEE